MNKKFHLAVLAFVTFCYLTYYNYSIGNKLRLQYDIHEKFTLPQANIKVNQKQEPDFDSFQWCPGELETNLDCDTLLSGSYSNTDAILKTGENWTSPCKVNDTEVMWLTSNCTRFENSFPFWSNLYKNPNETTDYPLAFVIIGAQSAEQIMRLFQMIYHPNNLYCITYDNKTSLDFKQSLRNIDSCYDNIIMPKTFVDIHWGGYSILQSAMYCMKELADHESIKWKYVQILSWNDIPLKTNEEMIEIMKILNGSQDAELTFGQSERFRLYHRESSIDATRKNDRKPIPPGNLIIYKGSMAATMSNEFVQFLFHNPVAIQFFNWSQTMFSAEEQFWSTMVHNLHLNPPGGFPGSCLHYYQYDGTEKNYISRYQIWYDNKKCHGKMTHGSCVFGVGDLPSLIAAKNLVAHKIYLDYQPATYYCLSQWHFKKKFSLANNSDYSFVNDLNFYRNLPGVLYHNSDKKDEFRC